MSKKAYVKCPFCGEIKETTVYKSLDEMLPHLTDRELTEMKLCSILSKSDINKITAEQLRRG